jgi:hypothetical protein
VSTFKIVLLVSVLAGLSTYLVMRYVRRTEVRGEIVSCIVFYGPQSDELIRSVADHLAKTHMVPVTVTTRIEARELK